MDVAHVCSVRDVINCINAMKREKVLNKSIGKMNKNRNKQIDFTVKANTR